MEIKLDPIPLKDLIGEGGDNLNRMLHSFSCEVNESIERFLHEGAVQQEKETRARTTLMVDRDTGNIAGYFTILVENFNFTTASGKNRKRIAGDKRAAGFNCILIGKIGRSDKYKGKVPGSEILKAAIYTCSLINDLTAMKVVCVEYEDKPKLKHFYEENKFKLLQENENGLNISFLKI